MANGVTTYDYEYAARDDDSAYDATALHLHAAVTWSRLAALVVSAAVRESLASVASRGPLRRFVDGTLRARR